MVANLAPRCPVFPNAMATAAGTRAIRFSTKNATLSVAFAIVITVALAENTQMKRTIGPRARNASFVLRGNLYLAITIVVDMDAKFVQTATSIETCLPVPVVKVALEVTGSSMSLLVKNAHRVGIGRAGSALIVTRGCM
jgi:hypothetical protein